MPGVRPAGSAADPARSPGKRSPTKEPRPLGEAIGRTRESAMGLLNAHLSLLKAELAVTGRGIGLIIALIIAALSLALLMVGLIYTGTWLFVGEWWFGSIGWGVLHGSLFTIALIVPIALDLSGGWVGAWGRALLIGAGVTVLLSLLFGSNLLRDAAVGAGEQLEMSLALEPALLPTIVGFVVGAFVGGSILFSVGLRGGGAFRLLAAGVVLGGLVGMVLGSVEFDISGAVAVALTFGLVSWIGFTVLLAARRGFDPAARYDPLVPRESIAALESSKAFLVRQWERQRRKVMGR